CYYMFTSAVLIYRGNAEAAHVDATRAAEIARNCGQISIILAALCTTFADIALMRGDWEEAYRVSLPGNDEALHGAIARNWRLHGLYFLARAKWHSGDIDGLRKIYDAAMVPNPVEAPPTVTYRSLIRGMMRLAERSYAQAEAAFRQAVQ